MSKTIYNVSLADVLPSNMANDPHEQALCAAFDAMAAVVANAIPSVLVLANVGNQPAAVTDLLAIEQQTPYYNQALALNIRQALVAGGGKLNSIKGTKAAVEQAVQEAFGSGTVQEWFEYGGNPFCFKVLVNDFPDSDTQVTEIERAIAATQNARSHLDALVIVATTDLASGYMAATLSIGVIVNVTMQAPS